MSSVLNNRATGWPEALLNAVWVDNLEAPDVLPVDIYETVEFIVTMLEDREQAVLRMRFQEGLTLRECGCRLNVTHERIRQIEVRALRRLRHPKRNSILCKGIAKHAAEHASAMEQIRVAALEKKATEEARARELVNTIGRHNAEGIARIFEKGLSPTIDCFELPHRAHKRLEWNHLDSLEALCAATPSELLSISGFGVGMLEAVKAALALHGLKLQPDLVERRPRKEQAVEPRDKTA